MSSLYRFLCMNHDPAIEFGPEDVYSVSRIEDLARARQWSEDVPWSDHAQCDVLIGRYSSPLIEVGCVPGFSGCPGWHSDMQWVRREWLWLAYSALNLTGGVHDAAKAIPRCWTPSRLARLAPHLRRD